MTCVEHAGYLEETAKPLLGENRKIYKKRVVLPTAINALRRRDITVLLSWQDAGSRKFISVPYLEHSSRQNTQRLYCVGRRVAGYISLLSRELAGGGKGVVGGGGGEGGVGWGAWRWRKTQRDSVSNVVLA